MYRIRRYRFIDFQCQANLHKSNYAVLIEQKEKGIKYAPYADFSLEYNLLREINHKQIPKVYDIGQGDLFKDDKLLIKQNFIVLQHINGFDLVNYFLEKNIEDSKIVEEVINLFITACDPLQYLHNKNYLHCDLKPGHLILNKKTRLVHIIDFELAIEKGDLLKGISKEYASPEQLQLLNYLRKLPENFDKKSIPAEMQLDGRTDLYALGLILYQILTKRLWQEENVLPSKVNHFISHKLEQTITGLLEDNVSNRISSAEELKKTLQDV